MSKGDVTIVGGGSVTPVINYPVDDRTTSSQTEVIQPGEPVQLDNENYVEIIADGGPVQTDGLFVGIANNVSTETSSAEGVVDVSKVVPEVTLLRTKAETASDINTAAKLLAIRNDCVTFTNTSNVITINASEGDDPNVHGLLIVGGDIINGTLDFYLKPLACVGGRSV
jgi:hypothetical protein